MRAWAGLAHADLVGILRQQVWGCAGVTVLLSGGVMLFEGERFGFSMSPCSSSLLSRPLPAAFLLPYLPLSSPVSPAWGHALGWGQHLGLGDMSRVGDGLLRPGA